MSGKEQWAEMQPVEELVPLKDPAPECPRYFQKMKGAGEKPPPKKSLYYSLFSFLGAFAGMAAIGLLHRHVALPQGFFLMVGAFGAMSVIVFSAYQAPVAQPYNVIVGNTIGGIVGVSVFKIMAVLGLGHMIWLSAALSVSLTIVVQELTKSVHPPGGATAIIFVTMVPVQAMGWSYVFCPSFLGAVLLVAVACVTNNLSKERTYPQYWSPYNPEPAEDEESGPDNVVAQYLIKFRGAGAKALPAASPPLSQTWCSFLGSFTGIAVLGLLNTYVVVPMMHEVLLIGAFGAMSVIVYSAWKVPFAQPKHAIIGNTIGGFVGVTVYHALQLAGLGGQEYVWLGAALSVSLTILLQEVTDTVHPPGGATALLFEIIPLLHRYDYMYVVTPSFLGTVIIVLVGCLTNNLVEKRAYPQWWFPF